MVYYTKKILQFDSHGKGKRYLKQISAIFVSLLLNIRNVGFKDHEIDNISS